MAKLLKRSALASALLALSACSSAQKWTEKPVELSSTGPTILNARSEPTIITLNRDLQPNEQAQIIADVKDFKAPVTEVRIQFRDVPLQVLMEKVGGTTWRGELTPRELQMLAVSGTTVQYKAEVIATDQNGTMTQSRDLVDVAISAPDIGAKKRLS